jgi:mRNA interferase MazF
MYIKEFDTWNSIKKEINEKEKPHKVRVRELRWGSLGVNVGSEIDGKGNTFTRPLIILSLAGPDLALVVPCSTKLHDRPGYIKIQLKNKEVSACIHQMKIISTKRIYDRIQKVSQEQVNNLKNQIKEFYNL